MAGSPPTSSLRPGRTARLVEEVLVVVDDEARDVLGHADLLAVHLERLHRLGIELVGAEHVRRIEVRLHGLQDALDGELPVEAVVHQEQVRWGAARERGRQPGDQVVAIAGLDELDSHARFGCLEGIDELAVRH